MLIKSQQKWLRQGVEQFALRFINLIILFGKRRNYLRSGRSWSLYLAIKKDIKQTVVIIEAYHFCQLHTKFYPTSCVKVNSVCRGNYCGYQCGFLRSRSSSDHILCIRQILEEKWEYNEAVHQLFVDFKKAYYSVRREVLYNILIGFGIPMKLVRLIKMCLAETCSRVQVSNRLSDMKIALFWIITQQVVVISYRCCGTAYQSHLFWILDPM